MALVVSKVDTSENNLEWILKDINGIVKKNKNFHPKAKTALEALVKGKRVVLFPLLTHEDNTEEIRKKIEETKPFTLTENAVVSLSSDAKLKLKEWA